ncbi:hypothetical protein AVEN_189343-1 [Araneus ventricosus]|uniref:Uncharacterized protein n=1 Tax=Araneus ventricosus TaxID=182803 RepID=A0A4Y2Q4U9_ARAVE|nr:hypothetical protein AVEN_189343-1 [Araneus ventricosus]
MGVSGGKRHELDSPNLNGHLSHHPALLYNLPLRRAEIGCGWQGKLNPVPRFTLKPFQNLTSPHKKPNASDWPASVLKVIFRPPGTASLGVRGLTSLFELPEG